MSTVTTHVLDTASGRPAAGVAIGTLGRRILLPRRKAEA